MEALSAPIFELRKDCDWYKEKVKRKEKINRAYEIIKERDYFPSGEFALYNPTTFGIPGNSEDVDTYRSQLLKNADSNGIYRFRKKSQMYKDINELFKGTDIKDPFKSHDTFGVNNVRFTQWLGDRFFVQVKNADVTRGNKTALQNEIREVPYAEYLKVLQEKVSELEESQ